MKNQVVTRLILLRHAPSAAGRLCGRTDVAADCTDVAAFDALRARLSGVAHIVSSPARRCLETVAALWPDGPPVATEPRLWEQDFGDWEGLALEDVPDLGALSGAALAEHRPPNGESFAEVCRRTREALAGLLAAHAGEVLCLCTHAGPIRAALALALDLAPGAALRFALVPLSMTTLSHYGRDAWSVERVNFDC